MDTVPISPLANAPHFDRAQYAILRHTQRPPTMAQSHILSQIRDDERTHRDGLWNEILALQSRISKIQLVVDDFDRAIREHSGMLHPIRRTPGELLRYIAAIAAENSRQGLDPARSGDTWGDGDSTGGDGDAWKEVGWRKKTKRLNRAPWNIAEVCGPMRSALLEHTHAWVVIAIGEPIRPYVGRKEGLAMLNLQLERSKTAPLKVSIYSMERERKAALFRDEIPLVVEQAYRWSELRLQVDFRSLMDISTLATSGLPLLTTLVINTFPNARLGDGRPFHAQAQHLFQQSTLLEKVVCHPHDVYNYGINLSMLTEFIGLQSLDQLPVPYLEDCPSVNEILALLRHTSSVQKFCVRACYYMAEPIPSGRLRCDTLVHLQIPPIMLPYLLVPNLSILDITATHNSNDDFDGFDVSDRRELITFLRVSGGSLKKMILRNIRLRWSCLIRILEDSGLDIRGSLTRVHISPWVRLVPDAIDFAYMYPHLSHISVIPDIDL